MRESWSGSSLMAIVVVAWRPLSATGRRHHHIDNDHVDDDHAPCPARPNRPASALSTPSLANGGLRDPVSGQSTRFYYGNPGDFPFTGDWNCDGYDTPGLYRQSDGYVYLRNSNTQGVADIKFFFGNPGDIPLAGDFDGDGCDSVSVYRPSESRVFVINRLGTSDEGLGAADYSFVFGDPGDKPFVGDFDYDGIDTVGLHREKTGLVYYRNSNDQGPAEHSSSSATRVIASSPATGPLMAFPPPASSAWRRGSSSCDTPTHRAPPMTNSSTADRS